MLAFSANAWRWLMPRLGVARGAVMVRGAEVLRCRTGDAACTVDLAPDLVRQRDWSAPVGPTGSTGTTRPRPRECGEMHASRIGYFGN
jgi:hypothetical protein